MPPIVALFRQHIHSFLPSYSSKSSGGPEKAKATLLRVAFAFLIRTWMCLNLIFHARTKHVEIYYQFIRDIMNFGEISLDYLKIFNS
uniref:Uncharacterized protein n=1 Tax=Physcomitrium patens TaxID=3218 RepID=A0A7I4EDM8_PHYPA